MNNLPLEDLPEYIKNLQNNNSFGNDVVVDMGNIKKPFNWNKSIFLTATLILALGTGILTYNLRDQNVTLVINSSSNNVQDIFKEYGVEATPLENQKNAYKVKLRVKHLSSFLEKLRKDKKELNYEKL